MYFWYAFISRRLENRNKTYILLTTVKASLVCTGFEAITTCMLLLNSTIVLRAPTFNASLIFNFLLNQNPNLKPMQTLGK